MVKLKTATKWLILKRFQHVIDCLLHISGLKYAEEKGAKMQAASDLTQSAKNKMVDGLSGMGKSLQRSGSGNPINLSSINKSTKSDE
tara:strand:+ start:7824 stop:8084 length:261 start_codon:yes stop_codon:yes gene_type:complete